MPCLRGELTPNPLKSFSLRLAGCSITSCFRTRPHVTVRRRPSSVRPPGRQMAKRVVRTVLTVTLDTKVSSRKARLSFRLVFLFTFCCFQLQIQYEQFKSFPAATGKRLASKKRGDPDSCSEGVACVVTTLSFSARVS